MAPNSLDHACQQHTHHNTDNQQPQPPDCHTKKRSSDTRRRGATQTDTCVHVRRQHTCSHTLCAQPYFCMHHRQQSAQRLALARADRYCHYCVTMITQLVCIGTAMRRHAQCDSAGQNREAARDVPSEQTAAPGTPGSPVYVYMCTCTIRCTM